MHTNFLGLRISFFFFFLQQDACSQTQYFLKPKNNMYNIAHADYSLM